MTDMNKGFNNYDCKVTSNLHNCENKAIKPKVSLGKIYSKVPVVLAELDLQLNLDETITFPEPVLEIKDIKKRVNLTQCRLLLPTHKLFIKGFVRKNIQYASPSPEIDQSTSKSVASDLHSFTVDIPFECVTEIKDFLSYPVQPKINNREEFDFAVTKSLPSGFPEKDQLLTSDLSQFHQESRQFYNELPFCELISSSIIEWDEALDRMPLPGDAPFNEGYFTKVEEKMVLDIRLKVLQNQQIRVASTTNDYCEKDSYSESCD
ncbi:CsxC family protein [Halobacillus mangrovi]|uniref:CsxC family protein n=1 Tax=Halobacillus mangrovi TaxID=402384 RepID=UPI003D95B318